MAEVAFTDVNRLPVVNASVARKVLNACIQAGATGQASTVIPLRFVDPEIVTRPGTERWQVKTGQDPDVAKVGDLVLAPGKGIVPATVEDLIRIPRPADMLPVTSDTAAFEIHRRAPVEFTVWQVAGSIIFLRLESDGDYHMVVQGTSGDTLIVEVPTPTAPFLGSSPWVQNIKTARGAVDQKFASILKTINFTLLAGTLVPKGSSISALAQPLPAGLPKSLTTPSAGSSTQVPTFQTAIAATPARITGVGFFDRVHGQTGVASFNGIELHPVLKIEFLAQSTGGKRMKRA
ncbi:MAG: hypothetical protein C5B58_09530 [Acidobacteria bacterium]|nr:MAG: hypothetical protein C5B58_09530 [Acidobacteriota bacterium]